MYVFTGYPDPAAALRAPHRPSCVVSTPGWWLAGRHRGRWACAAARHQARWRRVGDACPNGAVHVLPEVATLTHATLVSAEVARRKLVASQRPRRTGDLALEHEAARGLLCGVNSTWPPHSQAGSFSASLALPGFSAAGAVAAAHECAASDCASVRVDGACDAARGRRRPSNSARRTIAASR